MTHPIGTNFITIPENELATLQAERDRLRKQLLDQAEWLDVIVKNLDGGAFDRESYAEEFRLRREGLTGGRIVFPGLAEMRDERDTLRRENERLKERGQALEDDFVRMTDNYDRATRQRGEAEEIAKAAVDCAERTIFTHLDIAHPGDARVEWQLAGGATVEALRDRLAKLSGGT